MAARPTPAPGAPASSRALREETSAWGRYARIDEIQIWSAFEETRPPGPFLSVWDGRGFESISWDGWRARAGAIGAALRSRGIQRGSVLGCILTNSLDACLAVTGAWVAGAAVASLPTRSRGMAASSYRRQLGEIVVSGAFSALLAERPIAGLLEDLGSSSPPVVAYDELAAASSIDPAPPAPDEVAFVQFSSGTTADPRGCLLTSAALDAQLGMLAAALDLDDDEQMAAWLPLSHDMGFIGCFLLSFAKGMRLVLGTPERFVGSPRTWFADCAESRATITVAPNFAFELAARAAETRRPTVDSLRQCVVGGERIDARTLERATRALGLAEQTLTPAYGLAEAALAVTMKPFGTRPVVRDGADGHRVVSVGRPLPGVEVRTADGGELVVRSPSLATGYLGRPELSAERFVEGELRTGDLGFFADGELFVTGRCDDVITIGGRNVSLAGLEARLAAQPAVRPGCCAVVALPGALTPRLVALVEPAEGAPFDHLGARLIETARATTGVQIAECLVVARGTLPKTPSGKLQRHRCKELLEAGEIELAGAV